MFVILLHLITLAMLFIATMEKVAIGFDTLMWISVSACSMQCASLFFPVLVAVGGSGELRPVVQLQV